MYGAISFLLTSFYVGSIIRCKVNCVCEFIKTRCIKMGSMINSISFVVTDEMITICDCSVNHIVF
jgi:hypothetical protein